MSLLTICQNASYDVGFVAPASIISNTDADALQLLRFANREVDILRQAHQWNKIIKEGTVTLSTSDQDYALASDFDYMIPNSIWNRNTSRPVITSITSEEWQFEKGWGVGTSISLRARIRAGELEFTETISSSLNGEVIKYDYASKWIILASGDSAATKRYFTVDTDTCSLDEELITLGVVWRYKKSKGLPDWQIDQQEYLIQRNKAIARDKGPKRINMQSTPLDIYSNYPEKNYTL